MTRANSLAPVVGVAVTASFDIRVLFADGRVRDVRFTPAEARGSMVEPLKDPGFFAQVRVDPDSGTVVWPNGFDLAPDALHAGLGVDGVLGFHDVTALEKTG